MVKQTMKSNSSFGGDWTKEKLQIIDKYLKFYVNALKNLKFDLVYIDAFAGSGKTQLPTGEEVDGSAIISLNCDFDKYYFIELNEDRAKELDKRIRSQFLSKSDKISIIRGDSNNELKKILKSLNNHQRGVMFLDPYAMELNWEILEFARKTEILDIWYLFPLSALTRNLYKKLTMSDAIKEKITKILGTKDWEKELYHPSKQISMFDEIQERVNFDSLVEFVKNRLESNFPYVSPKSRMFKNSNSSPLFILFFIMTNTSEKAKNLGSRVVNDIFNKMDRMTKGEV